MRSQHLWAGMAAVVAVGLIAAQPSQAGDRGYRAWDRGADYRPAYYQAQRVHRPRPVVSGYFIADPYAYRYEPRGYYPYYDAGYWRPICGAKLNCVPRGYQPPYWKAWGYPKPWLNRPFHRVYHGRIYPWHW